MSKKDLPSKPSLDHLKHQARDLLAAHAAGDSATLERIREHHPRFAKAAPEAVRAAKFALSDAQLTIAREYRFSSWPALRAFLQTVREFATYPMEPLADTGQNAIEALAGEFLRLACLTYSADHPSRREKARQLLAEHPGIAEGNVHVASAIGDAGAVRALLEKNPSLAKGKGGPYNWPPLLYAAYARVEDKTLGHSTLEAARLLLSAGADPNAGFLWEGFPSPFTVLTGVFGEGEAGPANQPRHPQDEAFAKLLLAAGADPNDNQALYNRMFTRGTSHLELLFAYGLGKGGDGPWFARMGEKLEPPGQMLVYQLHHAARENHLDRVKLLIRHGVDLNAPQNGRTPCETALLNGHREIADLLLASGAPAAQLDQLDRFAAACKRADEAETTALLQSDSTLQDKLGPRRIHLMTEAAGQNQLAAVQLMARLGFEVNPTDGSASPLHQAAWFGHLEMAKLLVSLGANTVAIDRSHSATPLQWAQYNQQAEVAAYLQSLQ